MTRPVFLCLDIQRAFIEPGPLYAPHAGDALLNCARLLANARSRRWVVAHCLLHRKAEPLSVTADSARPVDGFKPLVRELVFERASLSAYGHGDFCELMTNAEAVVVAGLSASLTFVATAMDAFEHGHQWIVAADALAGPRGPEAAARQHESVSRDIAALLGFSVAAAERAAAEPHLIVDHSK